VWNFCFSQRQAWRWQPSGIQRRVVSLKYTDVSEVRIASTHERRSTLTRIHGAISQKAVICSQNFCLPWKPALSLCFTVTVAYIGYHSVPLNLSLLLKPKGWKNEGIVKPHYSFYEKGLILEIKKSSPSTRHGSASGERRYSSYSFTTSALDGVSGQHHDPAALYPRGKDPRYPLYRRLGGPQSRSGHRG
jgi:hypothetical protein